MQTLTLFYTAQVEAVTRVRKDSLGRRNIGVLIKNVNTKEQEWINSYNNFDLKWGDYVCYELFSNNNERLTIINKDAAEF